MEPNTDGRRRTRIDAIEGSRSLAVGVIGGARTRAEPSPRATVRAAADGPAALGPRDPCRPGETGGTEESGDRERTGPGSADERHRRWVDGTRVEKRHARRDGSAYRAVGGRPIIPRVARRVGPGGNRAGDLPGRRVSPFPLPGRYSSRCSIPCLETFPFLILSRPSIHSGLSSGGESIHAHAS